MMMAAGVSGMPGAATTALVYLPPRDVDPKAATLCFTDEPAVKKPNTMKPFLCWKVRMGKDMQGRPAQMVPCWPEYNHVQTTPEGPGNNALGSGLFGKLSRGKHAKMLTDAEKRVLATWIDLNATFYGCYEEPNLSRQLRGEPIHMLERQ